MINTTFITVGRGKKGDMSREFEGRARFQ